MTLASSSAGPFSLTPLGSCSCCGTTPVPQIEPRMSSTRPDSKFARRRPRAPARAPPNPPPGRREGRPPQPLLRGLEQADGTVTYTGAAYEGYRTEQPVERIAQVLKDQLQNMVAKAVAASIPPRDTTVGVAPPGASSSLGPAGLMTTKEVDMDIILDIILEHAQLFPVAFVTILPIRWILICNK